MVDHIKKIEFGPAPYHEAAVLIYAGSERGPDPENEYIKESFRQIGRKRVQRTELSGFDIILKFLQILVHKKKLILGITGAGTLVACVTVFFLPKSYRATGLVKPPVSESGGSLNSLLNEAGPLSGLMGSLLPNQSGEDDCLSIMASAQFARKVIEKFDLVHVYKFDKQKKYYMADVMKAYSKKAGFETTDEHAIVISVEDKSIERSKDMAVYIIGLLDSMYIDLQKKTINQKLGYYNERVGVAEREMTILEDSLAHFQNKNHLYLPEQQVKATLELTVNLEAQIEVLGQEMDLESSLRGKDTPRYQKLDLQKRRLQKELRSKFEGSSDTSSLNLPINVVPSLALEYYRIERAYNIKLTLFKFLIQQVEMLKLEQAKNIKAISVIDPPWANDKKVSPKRRLIIQIVFLALLAFSSLLAVILTLWEKHKTGNTDTYRRIQDIRNGLFDFK